MPADLCVEAFAAIKDIIAGLDWVVLQNISKKEFQELGIKRQKKVILAAFWEKVVEPKFIAPVVPQRLQKITKYLVHLHGKPVLNFLNGMTSLEMEAFTHPPQTYCISHTRDVFNTEESTDFAHALKYPNYMGMIFSKNALSLNDLPNILAVLELRKDRGFQQEAMVLLDLSENQLQRGKTSIYGDNQFSSQQLLNDLATYVQFINICDNPLASFYGAEDLCALPLETLSRLIWIQENVLKNKVWQQLFEHAPDKDERIQIVSVVHAHFYAENLGEITLQEIPFN